MKIIDRHLLSSFLVTFLVSMLVLLFVMSLVAMLKMVDLIGRGAPWQPLGLIFVLNVPQILSFCTPMAVMVATLLVYGRMSADGEITAMRSCGIGLWQINFLPLAVAFLLGVACLGIHNWVVPRSHHRSREVRGVLKHASLVSLLDEGRFIQAFPGISLYIGRKNGGALKEVRIYAEMDDDRVREIRADSGVVIEGTNGGKSLLELTGVRIDPFLDDRPGAAYCETWTVELPDGVGQSRYRPKPVDLTWGELRERIRETARFFPLLNPENVQRESCRYTVEFHKRLVFSIACPIFVLLGFSLALQTHRRESTIGIGMSVLSILAYNMFVIGAEAMKTPHAALPVAVMWTPVVLGLAGALWMLEKKK